MNPEIVYDLSETPFFARDSTHTVNDVTEKGFLVPVTINELFPSDALEHLQKLGECPDTVLERTFYEMEEARLHVDNPNDTQALIQMATERVCNSIINDVFDEEDQGTEEISARDLVQAHLNPAMDSVRRTVDMVAKYFPMPSPAPDDDGFIVKASIKPARNGTGSIVNVAWNDPNE